MWDLATILISQSLFQQSDCDCMKYICIHMNYISPSEKYCIKYIYTHTYIYKYCINVIFTFQSLHLSVEDCLLLDIKYQPGPKPMKDGRKGHVPPLIYLGKKKKKAL